LPASGAATIPLPPRFRGPASHRSAAKPKSGALPTPAAIRSRRTKSLPTEMPGCPAAMRRSVPSLAPSNCSAYGQLDSTSIVPPTSRALFRPRHKLGIETVRPAPALHQIRLVLFKGALQLLLALNPGNPALYLEDPRAHPSQIQRRHRTQQMATAQRA